MAMITSFSSPPPPSSSFPSKTQSKPNPKPCLSFPFHPNPRTHLPLSLHLPRSVAGDGAGAVDAAEPPKQKVEPPPTPAASNGVVSAAAAAAAGGCKAGAAAAPAMPRFKDARWVDGTWDLKQFEKGGGVDWDAVIDAESRRRKWLEDFPEATSTDDAVVFDTSIIPWWAWIKRFHLPEAERLNGRAAMIGFFMAYFVDSLTGVGLVDQMGNFFCKTLLFVAIVGVLLIRKNEDIESLKKLIEETTFYDKQWQATWQEDSPTDTKK